MGLMLISDYYSVFLVSFAFLIILSQIFIHFYYYIVLEFFYFLTVTTALIDALSVPSCLFNLNSRFFFKLFAAISFLVRSSNFKISLN